MDQRQDLRSDRTDQRQDALGDRQEFRQDVHKEHHEYWHDRHEFYEDRWKYAVGASLSAAMFRSLTCTPTVIVVGNVSYYQCGPTWYQRAYSGGNVTYIVVTAPAGH